jgi:FKBP-type peptidyl-prolyl cis-trans isomerase
MKILPIILSVLILSSCKGKSPRSMTDQELAAAQKELIKENKRQHAEEMTAIREFIKTSNWTMQETPTGLQYWIYEHGTGENAQKDQHVWISYTISLLDGTVCYTADDNQPKEIHIGHDNIESGLHEAMQLMKAGDRAKFIFPSHLAFGFTGDSRKIPQNASVIYDIHLIRIQP